MAAGREARRVTAPVLLRVFLRSFLVQASWNFDRLQNLGALYVMAPALRLIHGSGDLAPVFQRHLAYFNTHPYLTAPIFGTTLALEERAVSGRAGSMGAQEFQRMIMAPYAAMGDAFFWGGLRPLAAGIALFFAARGSLWAPLVFLVLFNVPHLWLRAVGLVRGYLLGMGAMAIIQRHRLPDLAVYCKEMTVVLLGALSAYLVFAACRDGGVATGWGLALLPLLFAASRLVRRGLSTLLLVLVGSALVLLAAVLLG
jgi:PTS system mannose-specific IID component